jgi:hypothetical protein
MDHSLHTAHHEAGQVKVVFNGFDEKSPIHSSITTEQSPNRQTYGIALGFYLEQL